MNESLRRALLRARLTEEDVAARLQVDPKTVRRWLEGRVPYARHRWILASTLGLDEADLWPQLDSSRSWPPEVQAVYPRCEDVPRENWLRLFGLARERIDILAVSGLFLAADPDVWAIMVGQATAGVKERICLRNPEALDDEPPESLSASPADIENALARFASLPQYGDVEVRVHAKQLNSSIYRADGESLVTSGIYGIPPTQIPVLHLSQTRDGDLFESYLKSFEDVWASAYLH